MSNFDQFFLRSRNRASVSTRRTTGNKNTIRLITSHTVEATTPDEMEEALSLPRTRAMIESFLSKRQMESNPGEAREFITGLIAQFRAGTITQTELVNAIRAEIVPNGGSHTAQHEAEAREFITGLIAQFRAGTITQTELVAAIRAEIVPA